MSGELVAIFRGADAEDAARRVAEHEARNRAIEAARASVQREYDRLVAERRELARRALAERQLELPFDVPPRGGVPAAWGGTALGTPARR